MEYLTSSFASTEGHAFWLCLKERQTKSGRSGFRASRREYFWKFTLILMNTFPIKKTTTTKRVVHRNNKILPLSHICESSFYFTILRKPDTWDIRKKKKQKGNMHKEKQNKQNKRCFDSKHLTTLEKCIKPDSPEARVFYLSFVLNTV